MGVYKEKKIPKSGKLWYFSKRYIDAFGKSARKRSGHFATKREAEEAERDFLVIVRDREPDITFRQLFDHYFKHKKDELKESTRYCKIHKVEEHLMPYFEKMQIAKITMNTVIDWKDKLNNIKYKRKDTDKGKPYSLVYKQGLFIELQSILEHGKTFWNLKDNVAKKVGTFKSKSDEVIADEEKLRYIKPDDFKRMFEVMDDSTLWKTFFSFLYYMGCRKGEVQALRWEDIDFNTEMVRIIKTGTYKSGEGWKETNTKNRKNRKIKMPKILKNLIKEHLKEEQQIEGFNDNLYVFGTVKHLASITIDRMRKKYFDLVNEKYPNNKIRHITNHEFRHSHASLLISSGIGIDDIANRLGDTANTVRKVYAHLFPESQDKIIDLLDNI